MVDVEAILILLVGAIIVGVPLYLAGRLLFRKKIKQENNRKVKKEDLLTVIVTVSLLLVLFWFIEAGYKWASITLGVGMILAFVYGKYILHSKRK